jgi:hypothetical protein
MTAHSIALAELDEAQAVALMAKAGWTQKRTTYATFIVRRFVRFLSGRGVGRQLLPRTAKEIARTELKRDYEIYLRRQRGLSERTIFHSWRLADRFPGVPIQRRRGGPVPDHAARYCRLLAAPDDADAAVPRQDPIHSSAELLPVSLQSRQDGDQPCFVHTERCPARPGDSPRPSRARSAPISGTSRACPIGVSGFRPRSAMRALKWTSRSS